MTCWWREPRRASAPNGPWRAAQLARNRHRAGFCPVFARGAPGFEIGMRLSRIAASAASVEPRQVIRRLAHAKRLHEGA
jgi:hypothetical protein